MRQLSQIKIWVSKITCVKCGRTVIFQHGKMTKAKALKDWPSREWNGWSTEKGQELCPSCALRSRLLPVQQPDHRNNGKLQFVTGYTGGFGAEACVHLNLKEYRQRIEAKYGPGQLLELDGKFWWLPIKATTLTPPFTMDA